MSLPVSVLLFKRKWKNKILNGEKVWEIRGTPSKFPKRVLIAVKDKIYGEFELYDCVKTSISELREHRDKHCIKNIRKNVTYDQPYIWKIRNVISYEKKVRFKRKKGQQCWCSITEEEYAMLPVFF